MKNFNPLWKDYILKAMEDYDDYDPELIKKLEEDWEDLIKKVEENKDETC